MMEMKIQTRHTWYYKPVIYLCGRWPVMINILGGLTLVKFYVDGQIDDIITVKEAFKDVC